MLSNQYPLFSVGCEKFVYKNSIFSKLSILQGSYFEDEAMKRNILFTDG
jgi:hypothetical protein